MREQFDAPSLVVLPTRGFVNPLAIKSAAFCQRYLLRVTLHTRGEEPRFAETLIGVFLFHRSHNHFIVVRCRTCGDGRSNLLKMEFFRQVNFQHANEIGTTGRGQATHEIGPRTGADWLKVLLHNHALMISKGVSIPK